MVDETGIIPDGWSEKLPLCQLVDKAESYLRARGVKDADEKNKDKKKQGGRKPCQIQKYKEPDIQGDGRKKLPLYGTPNCTQQQPGPEVDNWQKHVKRHIFQHKLITDQNLETSSQFMGQFSSGCYYCLMDNHNHQQCGKLKYSKIKAQIEYYQCQQGGSSNPSQGNSTTTLPGVPQGARRVQDETEGEIISDANNSNKDSVTSYSASIASDVSLSSLSSSSSAPY